jgi:WG containing repeat
MPDPTENCITMCPVNSHICKMARLPFMLLLSGVLLVAVRGVRGDPPYLVGDGGSSWFVDKTGVNAFGIRFEEARPFSEGLAAVRRNGRWGYIHVSGVSLPQSNFSSAESFRGGFAVVSSNGLFGVIKRSGDLVVSISHADVKSLDHGFFAFKSDGKYGILDGTGSILVKPQFQDIGGMSLGVFLARTNWLWGAADINGVVSLPFDFARLGRFSDGVFAAQRQGESGVSYFKSGGVNAFGFAFVDGRSFINGKAFVLEQSGKWNLVDRSGKLVGRTMYDDVGFPAFGFVPVKVGTRWGLSSTDGKLAVPATYDRVSDVDQYGRAMVVLGNRAGYVSTNGGVLLQLKWWK